MTTTKATDEIVTIIEKLHKDMQNDEDTAERVAKKAKLCDALTKDEAVRLSNAAMLYHIIMGLGDWGYESIKGSEEFAERVVKLAETKLKAQYKEEFDVQAIAKALRKKADA